MLVAVVPAPAPPPPPLEPAAVSMEELEPAREQVNFVWLAVIGVVLAAAMGAGAVWIKRFVGRRVAPLPVAAVDDVDPEAAAAAVEVAARVANSASRLPANVRRMIREGTHADLEELCRHGGTALLQGAEDAQEGIHWKRRMYCAGHSTFRSLRTADSAHRDRWGTCR